MKPSKYQQDIYQNLLTTNKNLLVDAGPGSGKSTTLVEASKLLPYGKKCIFMAFNKRIVEELKAKLPEAVQCSTMHSLGMSAIRKYYNGNVKVDEKKQIKFIESFCDKEGRSPKEKWSLVYQVDKIMSLVRATMTPWNVESIVEMCERYAIDEDEEKTNITIRSLNKMKSYNNNQDRFSMTVDFQDMIEMPVNDKDIKMPLFDYVLIDECQDCSKLDQLFLDKLVKPMTGRKILVGDEKQSIYSFRGADPNSFKAFSEQKNTIKLPLSISYRCAKNIVKEAQKIYKDIEVCETNEDGIVRKGKVTEIQDGDFVLCRNVRPLVDVFLQLIELGKKVYIVGKDSEKGLLELLHKIRATNYKEAEVEIRKLTIQLEEQLKAKGVKNPAFHPKMISYFEKKEILLTLFKKLDLYGAVENFIETIFNDEERDGIALMTIHRSKGLECNTVFMIEKYEGRNLIPSTYAITPDQKKQEKNLLFVAITRAKKELVYLHL